VQIGGFIICISRTIARYRNENTVQYLEEGRDRGGRLQLIFNLGTIKKPIVPLKTPVVLFRW